MSKKNSIDPKEITGIRAFVSELEKGIENLWFLSETDAEISTVFFEMEANDLSKDIVLTAIGKPLDTSVEEREFDDFFVRLTRVYDGANDVVRSNAERFTRLRELLRSNLTGLRVFKIGTIRLDVLVVGLDAAGDIRGIRTFAVET